MGMIRTVLLAICTIGLFVSLLIGNTLWTVDMSLEQSVIQPEIASVTEGLLDKLEVSALIDENAKQVAFDCKYKNMTEVDYDDYFEVAVFDIPPIPCLDVINKTGEQISTSMIDDIVEGIYYADYGCSFLGCFANFNRGAPFFSVSRQAKDFVHSKFYTMLIITFILIGLILFLTVDKANALIILGSTSLLSSLPFMKFDVIISLFSLFFTHVPIIGDFIVEILSVFVSQSFTVFILTFSIGLFLLVFGVLMRFFEIGLWIEKFIPNFGKKEKKE